MSFVRKLSTSLCKLLNIVSCEMNYTNKKISLNLIEPVNTMENFSIETKNAIYFYPACFSREYIQPKKTNCFQLTTGRSGVYTFGIDRELNEKGKDFYQQYCEYSTEASKIYYRRSRDFKLNSFSQRLVGHSLDHNSEEG